jgi:hypothetical protein
MSVRRRLRTNYFSPAKSRTSTILNRQKDIYSVILEGSRDSSDEFLPLRLNSIGIRGRFHLLFVIDFDNKEKGAKPTHLSIATIKI